MQSIEKSNANPPEFKQIVKITMLNISGNIMSQTERKGKFRMFYSSKGISLIFYKHKLISKQAF